VVRVERVDFVSVPTRDTANARRFYGELLGLHESTTPEDVFPEFETANVTLGVFEPEAVGMPFVPSAGVALRVPDVEAARRELEAAGVEFGGDTQDARTAVRCLSGLHDIRKATPAFAVQNTQLGQRMSVLGLYTPPHKNDLPDRQLAHHTITGHNILRSWLLRHGWDRRTVDSWAIVVGGHHGVPPVGLEVAHVAQQGVGKAAERAVDELERHLDAPVLPLLQQQARALRCEVDRQGA
jgi:catechol 2,3-dioxygenase-like lactoylglutathione lyase family enzyme